MPVDFKDYARRMDKALEHLQEEFGAVRAAAPIPRFWTVSPWNTMVLKHL